VNCKYCGAALPTKGGHCPQCGRMIPVSQQKELKKVIDPKWNEYRNIYTSQYKKESNGEVKDERVGKVIVAIILIIIILIIIAIFKSK